MVSQTFDEDEQHHLCNTAFCLSKSSNIHGRDAHHRHAFCNIFCGNADRPGWVWFSHHGDTNGLFVA